MAWVGREMVEWPHPAVGSLVKCSPYSSEPQCYCPQLRFSECMEETGTYALINDPCLSAAGGQWIILWLNANSFLRICHPEELQHFCRRIFVPGRQILSLALLDSQAHLETLGFRVTEPRREAWIREGQSHGSSPVSRNLGRVEQSSSESRRVGGFRSILINTGGK